MRTSTRTYIAQPVVAEPFQIWSYRHDPSQALIVDFTNRKVQGRKVEGAWRIVLGPRKHVLTIQNEQVKDLNGGEIEEKHGLSLIDGYLIR